MAKQEAKFEEKLKELESIIADLENGEIDLDQSIEKLKSVEEQVSKLVTEEGEIQDFEME